MAEETRAEVVTAVEEVAVMAEEAKVVAAEAAEVLLVEASKVVTARRQYDMIHFLSVYSLQYA